MDISELKQLGNLMKEIMEDEKRQYLYGCYSLINDEIEISSRKIQVKSIAEYINSIPDSVTRRAFKLRFLDNLSWNEVAIKMGYSSESGPRKLCERFLNK